MSMLNPFLVRLGSDAKLLLAMKRQPRQVMLDNGLSQEDIQLVMSKDVNMLRDKMGGKAMLPILIIHSFA
ncbi:hypothetical protein [Shewanella denitrificans]|jgi:hypothetical protein|uniref:hypothetical protein n=1 Tax=Shewanella denitrificans TaxID=192073 RepID=UPI0002E495D1|nr:hypothetical protein [Shewanella denitrificans]